MQLAIMGIVENKTEVSLTEEEAAAVADAIEQNKSMNPDEVGNGCKLPPGTRVDIAVSKQGGTKLAKLKKKTAAIVRS